MAQVIPTGNHPDPPPITANGAQYRPNQGVQAQESNRTNTQDNTRDFQGPLDQKPPQRKTNIAKPRAGRPLEEGPLEYAKPEQPKLKLLSDHRRLTQWVQSMKKREVELATKALENRMSTDYVKSMEEQNTELKNRLRQLESQRPQSPIRMSPPPQAPADPQAQKPGVTLPKYVYQNPTELLLNDSNHIQCQIAALQSHITQADANTALQLRILHLESQTPMQQCMQQLESQTVTQHAAMQHRIQQLESQLLQVRVDNQQEMIRHQWQLLEQMNQNIHVPQLSFGRPPMLAT